MNEEKKRPVFINRSASDSSLIAGCLRRRNYNHHANNHHANNHHANNHHDRATDDYNH